VKDGPAFQMYSDLFYIDTAEWDPYAVGMYTRMLLCQWANGSVSANEKELMRITGSSQYFFKKFSKEVLQKFILSDDLRYRNPKMEEVREKQRKYRESQSERGKKSAQKRWGSHVTGVITPVQPALIPDCNSSSSLKEEIYKEEKNVYGEFKNVKLTDEEFKKLTDRFGEHGTRDQIENLSQYLASKGKQYKSHYATILNWERKNGGTKPTKSTW